MGKGSKYMIPVRCFTCGRVTGNLSRPFAERQTQKGGGMTAGEALTSLGLSRYCCRNVVLTHVDSTETVISLESTKNFQHRRRQSIIRPQQQQPQQP